MSRAIDVVKLTGAEYDALITEINALRGDLKQMGLERDALSGNQSVLANQCAMLNLKLSRAYEYIKHAKYEKDYACADCDPEGECVVPGYLCAFHEAVE